MVATSMGTMREAPCGHKDSLRLAGCVALRCRRYHEQRCDLPQLALQLGGAEMGTGEDKGQGYLTETP